MRETTVPWARGFVLAAVCLASAGCGPPTGGRPRGSLRSQFEAALRIRHPESRARRLIQIAEKQDAAGDVLGAETSWKLAAQAALSVERDADRAAMLNLTAHALAKTDRRSQARKLLQEAARTSGEIADRRVQALVMAQMALTYSRYLNNPAAAENCLEEAAAAAESVESPEQRASALAQVAYARHLLDGEAEESTRLAIEAARAAADSRKRADSLAEVAARLCQMDESDQGAAIFLEAEREADAIEDPLSRGYALLNQAAKRRSSGDQAGAAKLLRRAETAADKVGDRNMANPLIERIRRERRPR